MRPQGKTWHREEGDMLLGLRTVEKDGSNAVGFKWPLKVGAWVEAPDWDATPQRGRGLHYLPWGDGDGERLRWYDEAVWLVVAVQRPYVELEGEGKCKRCRVVHVGTRYSATDFLAQYAPFFGRIVGVSLFYDTFAHVVGYRGIATAYGCSGKAIAEGYYGLARARGDCGNALATGKRGVALVEGKCGCAKATGKGGKAITVGGGWACADGEDGEVILRDSEHEHILRVGHTARRGIWYTLGRDGEVVPTTYTPPANWEL